MGSAGRRTQIQKSFVMMDEFIREARSEFCVMRCVILMGLGLLPWA